MFLSSHLKPGQRLLAAFSGGLDSRVLLQLLVGARIRHGFVLEAMYVHHGLSANADAWAEFCERECRQLGVVFHCRHVHVDRQAGLGVEAAARQARYAALLSMPADHVMLAHHQDDQAETLLLQLLRGAGTKGLSAMAVCDMHRRLLRPLLDCSRTDLEVYARQEGLNWIEDESNADTTYDRNFVRHEVLPLIEQRFPAARKTLARSSMHLAEAASLLDELAAIDAQAAIEDNRVNLVVLADLSEVRARNLLRWWLASFGLPMPGLPRLQEMLQQLLQAGNTALLKVQAGKDVWLRRYQGWAFLSPEPPMPYASVSYWNGEQELLLLANGRLLFLHVQGCGISLQRIQGKKLSVRYRSGGERFKPDAKRPTRNLKQLYQELSCPPWLRERQPLLYLDDELVMVPNVGVACQWQAQAGEEGLIVEWQPLSLRRLASFE